MADYEAQLADGILVLRITRSLDFEELLAVIDDVSKKYDCDRRLWDLTEHLDFSTEQMERIAARGKLRWPTPARVAYLAKDDLAFALLRVFEVYRETEGYATRVFRSEEEAREWLKEDLGGTLDG